MIVWIEIKKAKYPTLWYVGEIGSSMEVFIRDDEFYECIEEEKDETWITYLIYKEDADIIKS